MTDMKLMRAVCDAEREARDAQEALRVVSRELYAALRWGWWPAEDARQMAMWAAKAATEKLMGFSVVDDEELERMKRRIMELEEQVRELKREGDPEAQKVTHAQIVKFEKRVKP